jgi:hypothetical protein
VLPAKSNTTETPSERRRVASGAISRRMRVDAAMYCGRVVIGSGASVASHSSSMTVGTM